MANNKQWLRWAIELQSIAQAGLTYGRDIYDRERYQRLRELSAEIMAAHTGLPMEKVKSLFCNESGYQTPKLETRAAIFKDGKILLVQENDGRWSLPGGWVDVNVSVKENAVKEVKEEAGLDVTADLLIAVQDIAKHNRTDCPYGICKVFVLCTLLGGSFQENIETIGSGYFDRYELPQLAEDKNTAEQICLCFDAHDAEHWQTQFD